MMNKTFIKYDDHSNKEERELNINIFESIHNRK